MIARSRLSGTLLCIALLATGCGSPSGPTEKPSAEPGSAAPVPALSQATAPVPAEEAQVADAEVAADEAMDTPVSAPQALAPSAVPPPAAAPAATIDEAPPVTAPTPAREPTAATPTIAKAPPVATPTPAPAPAPSAASPAPVVPAAPAAKSGIADPGGTVAVAAPKPGLERIGADACGDCHDVQFESWAEGAHARRKPPLDCEHCHGPGSEYEPKSVMKDPVKAKAAGLVMPDKAFCAKCHTQGVDDAFMEKAHAHAE